MTDATLEFCLPLTRQDEAEKQIKIPGPGLTVVKEIFFWGGGTIETHRGSTILKLLHGRGGAAARVTPMANIDRSFLSLMK